MKITKSRLKQIIKETLTEGEFGGFGNAVGNLSAVAGRDHNLASVDSPDSILQKQGVPDTAIKMHASQFFIELGITDKDVCRTLVDNIAVPDLKEIMRLIPTSLILHKRNHNENHKTTA